MNPIEILSSLYLLIAIGALLKHCGFPNEEFWPGLERTTYFILFPALVTVSLARSEINAAMLGSLLLLVALPHLLIAAMQWLVFLFPSLRPATFTSVFQGAIRNNTTIGLVIATWLVPEQGIGIIAVILLIMIPITNLLCVGVLLHYGAGGSIGTRHLIGDLLRNPLILACIAGIALNLSPLSAPRLLLDTADFLGRSALPLALLAVGAGLRLNTFRGKILFILFATLSKLVVLPIIVYLVARQIGAAPNIAKITIIYAALPTATSSFILARLLGGDSDTMAQIITFQTLAAAITLPLFLALAQGF
jgi:predicted permease